MSHWHISLIFAAGIEDVISVIILVIAFLGWLLSLAGGKNQPPRAGGGGARRPPRPRDDRLSREIDDFLREAGGPKRGPGEAGQPARSEEVPIEIVPEEERRPRRVERSRVQGPRAAPERGPQPRRPGPQPARGPTPAPEPSPAPPRRRSPIADREAFDSDRLGAEVRSHLTQFMDEHRVDQDVQEHLRHAVDESVRQHLGAFGETEADRGSAAQGYQPSDLPRQLIPLLHDRAGLRQAIVLNEVLSRPLALRRR